MKIKNYIEYVGMKAIAEKCFNNLRAIRNHLRRECDITSNQQINYYIRKFKQFFKQSEVLESNGYIEEILRKVGKNDFIKEN